jgi:hypothetical protein
MKYLITALVRPITVGGTYIPISFGSNDDLVHNHNTRLQGEGYEVLDVKVRPWPTDGVIVDSEMLTEEVEGDPLLARDPVYDADATPGFGELVDETDTDTDEVAGSSD